MPVPFQSRGSDYPPELASAEQAAIADRRSANGLEPRARQVGFALSGGGIHSATFCLELFQALARQRLIRRINYLSTVSGGGYFGSFLGAAFNRDNANGDEVERKLGNNHSWSVCWLCENGISTRLNGNATASSASTSALHASRRPQPRWSRLAALGALWTCARLKAPAVLQRNLCNP